MNITGFLWSLITIRSPKMRHIKWRIQYGDYFWLNSTFFVQIAQKCIEKPFYIHFCVIRTKNVKFSHKSPPYLIYHFEFRIFELSIIISDNKNTLLFISVKFENKTSNLFENGRHIESAVLNFWILTANRNERPQKPMSLIIFMFHAREKCAFKRVKEKSTLEKIKKVHCHFWHQEILIFCNIF